jgi:hypothetical protein
MIKTSATSLWETLELVLIILTSPLNGWNSVITLPLELQVEESLLFSGNQHCSLLPKWILQIQYGSCRRIGRYFVFEGYSPTKLSYLSSRGHSPAKPASQQLILNDPLGRKIKPSSHIVFEY